MADDAALIRATGFVLPLSPWGCGSRANVSPRGGCGGRAESERHCPHPSSGSVSLRSTSPPSPTRGEGKAARLAPGFAALNPGYACCVSRAQHERSEVVRCRSGTVTSAEIETLPDAVHRFALHRIRETSRVLLPMRLLSTRATLATTIAPRAIVALRGECS
jgi:hypothetical protein